MKISIEFKRLGFFHSTWLVMHLFQFENLEIDLYRSVCAASSFFFFSSNEIYLFGSVQKNIDFFRSI